MTIELPAELHGLAARVGVRWPEADEDAMRRLAGSWRETARSVDVLVRDADSTAGAALGAIEGETADAARAHWNGLVESDTGRLPMSSRACTDVADRLDHAAEQVAATKVRIVRELVALAKHTDAAEQAAAAGHPQALAGVDTLLRSTSTTLAGVHATLTTAVDIDRGVTVDPGASPARPEGILDRLTDPAPRASTAGGEFVSSTADSVKHGATEGVDVVAVQEGAPRDSQGSGVGESAAHRVEVPPGGAEHTGPVSAEAITGVDHRPSELEEAGTGPLPVIGSGQVSDPPTGGTADVPATGVDPASITAPRSVHQAWAAPPAAGGPVQGFAGPAHAPPPMQSGHGQSGQYVPPPPGGNVPAAGPVRPPAAPPAAGARPPAAPMFGSPATPGQHQAQPGTRGAFRAGAAPVPPTPGQPPSQPPPPPHAEPSRRPLRQGDRNSAVVAFVLHQFPIGHMPVAASRPSRQWSVPAAGDESVAGLRFPPQDHPRSMLVEDFDALARVRSGGARNAVAEAGRKSVVEQERRIPEELLDGYDPLGEDGELSEAEWEHRYVRQGVAADHRTEYCWPAYSGFPEGCVESGEPIVLAEDTVADHIGDGRGRILAVESTSFSKRSLPPEYLDRDYRRYRVMRPLPVWQGISASWFAQPGGGARYRTTHPVEELVTLGYLVELVREEVTRQSRGSGTRTLRISTAPPTNPRSGGDSGGVATAESKQEAQ